MSEGTAEEIARRVAELLEDRIPTRYADTAAVARMLDVSEDWVRNHAAELGAVRIGDGPKGQLRFDMRSVQLAVERRRIQPPPVRQPRRPGARRRSLGISPAAIPADVRDW